MTDTAAPAEASTAPPSSGPPRPDAVRRWARRGLIALALALAVGVLVWSGQRAETTPPESTGDRIVVNQFPLAGGRALRQTQVIATLRPGYDGRLTINGIAVPEEQMDGVVPNDSPEAVGPNGEQLIQLRPNNRNVVSFSPGPGKVIEKLPEGQVTVTVAYFRDLAPELDRGAATWSFRAE